MDETGKRLHDAAEKCIKSHEAWQQDKKDQVARESLNESLHELRRATAALEIDMIREERLSGVSRPMPTPGHRSMRKPYHDDNSGQGDDIGNRGFDEDSDRGNGNGGGGHHQGGGHESRGPRRSSGGGGRSGGGRPQRSGPRDNGGNE